MSASPTPKQLAILVEIARFQKQRGYTPSIRELSEFLGGTSTNWIAQILKALEQKGMLIRTPGVARAMVLTQQGRRWCPPFAMAEAQP